MVWLGSKCYLATESSRRDEVEPVVQSFIESGVRGGLILG